MIPLYFGVALAVLAVVTAALAVRESVRWQRAVTLSAAADVALPSPLDAPTAPNTWRLLFALLLLIAALIAPAPPSIPYKAAIGFALLIFLLLEVLMAVPGTPEIVRTGTNCAVYFLLWLGFFAATGRALWTWWGLVALLPLVLAALYWWLLRPKLGYLQITIGVYVANAALVLAGAAALAATHFATWTLLALIGAFTLVSADALRGWDRFRSPIRRLRLSELLALATGWLLLCASVWGTTLPPLP